MSKGTITPRTIRHSEAFSIDEIVNKLIENDSNNADFYKVRAEKLEKKKSVAQTTDKTLESLEKYEAGPLSGVKTNHGKFKKHFGSFGCPEAPLKLADLAGITNDCVVTITYKYRALGEGENISSLNTPVITHYSMNAQKAEFLKGRVISDKELHPLEEYLIKKSLQLLDKKAAANDILKNGIKGSYQNNAVLVDIIARKNPQYDDSLKNPPKDLFNAYTVSSHQMKEYTIVYDDKAKGIETHTVVLWKLNDREVYLIDPSDYKFSSFLNDKIIQFRSGEGEECKYTIKNALKDGNRLYTGGAGKGIGGTPRDCTDIAVKIAFELIEQQKSADCNDTGSVLNKMIEQISNSDTAQNFKHFKFFHTSDYQLRKSAKEEMKKVKPESLQYLDATKLTTQHEMCEAFGLIGQLEEAGKVEILFQ